MKDPKENNNLIGTPVPLKSLTDYQAGSIVSRMVINKKAGTVTVFAFAKGEGLSEHSAPFDALVIALEGEADIPIGGVPHHVKEGDMLIMPANIPHAVHPVSQFKMMLVMIHE
ncbi:MAG: cupin domain-containing protein [Methanocorpusculum sp.]|jgi:quercetin dioxygenase-like cupin family protein|nr:cupin domain-containing protein [Methanocorpusculum sp.]MDD2471027.1 cupin domain-containing protein [Methanocorpusculum sp.]MDD3257536.1 cupin domain-containing protein [Methanocorpusculum sp.]MDD4132731.1 cupin domain-containing protein [Methanocorpusculum sp.]